MGRHPIPLIPSRLGRSLLAYLVINRNRPQMRDYLGGMFWPDLSEDGLGGGSATPSGRCRTPCLRSATHSGSWQSHPMSSHLHPHAPYWLDAEGFERTLEEWAGPTRRGRRRPTWSACVALSSSAAATCSPGSTRSGWLSSRSATSSYSSGALEQLVSLEKAHGNHEEALTYARRLTHHDPLREASHQEVMRLCFLLGRVNEAMATGVAPQCLPRSWGPALPRHHTLYDKIARYRQIGLRPLETEPPPPLFQPGGKAPFVGRAEERATLVDALESALASRGGVVVVEGEAGIGKTRLVREITEDARWRGFDVLWGACNQLGALRPYESLTSALAGGLTVLRTEQLSQQVGQDLAARGGSLIPSLEMWSSKLPCRLVAGQGGSGAQAGGAGATGAGDRPPGSAPHRDRRQWAGKDTLRA